MIAAPSKSKDLAKEFLENYVLSLEGLKTINADVPLGTPANKAFFKELFAEPEHQGDHGQRAPRRADAEHSGNGPLLVFDGIGAGKHHERPPDSEGIAGRRCRAHARQVSNKSSASNRRPGQTSANTTEAIDVAEESDARIGGSSGRAHTRPPGGSSVPE